MTRVDSAVLNLAEGLCQKFQLLTGRTNVWLALQLTNLSIIVYFVWAGLQFLNSDPATRTAIGVFCGGLLYVLTQTVFKVPIETDESDDPEDMATTDRALVGLGMAGAGDRIVTVASRPGRGRRGAPYLRVHRCEG